MCQVGVRCYADSSTKLKTETNRLNTVDKQIDSARATMTEAAKVNNFDAFSKARKEVSRLSVNREKIVFERNSAQRDVDGTRRGKAILDQQMLEAVTYREFEALKQRKQQGEAIAFSRAYAASRRASGKVSPIFLPGEKKPVRSHEGSRVAA